MTDMTVERILRESYLSKRPARVGPRMRLWTDPEGHVCQLGFTDAECLDAASEIAKVTAMSDSDYAAYIGEVKP